MGSPKNAEGGRGRPRKPLARANKTWTVEETLYLLEHWGSRGGIPGIAKALGRSVSAIKIRAVKLKLGPYIDGGELVSFNTICKLIAGEDVKSYSYTLERWQRLGIPIKMIRVQNNQFRMVSIDAFWRWAKQHQADIDFSRFPENSLGVEPRWAKRKRCIDKNNRRMLHPKKCAWTHDEEERLRWLLDHGATYADIESELKRSSGAIRRKIYDLYLPKPTRSKIIPWSENDIRRLVYLTDLGYSHEYIASLLNRSGQSVRGKVESLRMKGLWEQYEQKAATTKRSALPPPSHGQDEQSPRQAVRGTDRGELSPIRP